MGDVTFVHGSGEALPFADASFDLAISEYGVCLWCDPYRWVPEAARVLRPGGELIFLTNGLLSVLCMDEAGTATTTTLHRPLFGLRAQEWPDDDGDDSVEFHLPHGEWIRLLHEHGLQVERLTELRAPEVRDHAIRLRERQLGAQLAQRGNLGGAQGRWRLIAVR